METWALPEQDIIKVYVFGEIVSASDFGTDNLYFFITMNTGLVKRYVEYYIGFDKEKWKNIDNNSLNGVSQISERQLCNPTVNFCFPLEIKLEAHKNGMIIGLSSIHRESIVLALYLF